MASMKPTSPPVRCCIYARFSAEMQSPRSVDDQVRECRAHAEATGLNVVLVEADRAVRAGATAARVIGPSETTACDS